MLTQFGQLDFTRQGQTTKLGTTKHALAKDMESKEQPRTVHLHEKMYSKWCGFDVSS